MSYAEELRDITSLENDLSDIDNFTKYRIFFSDILNNRDDMLKKENQYIDEYLDYIYPLQKMWHWPVSLVLTALLGLWIFIYNNFSWEWNFDFFFNTFAHLRQPVIRSAFDDILDYLMSSVSGVLIILTGLPLIFFLIWDIFSIFHFPYALMRYAKAKRKTKKYLNNIPTVFDYRNARSSIQKIDTIIPNCKQSAEKLFNKHKLDKSLQNRENIAFIKELLIINKEKSPTISSIANFILKKNLTKDTFETEKWAAVLLAYDTEFVYYAFENPWLIKPKRQREKFHKVIWSIVKFPFLIIKWWFEMLMTILGVNIERAYREGKEQAFSSNHYTSSSNRSEFSPTSAYGSDTSSESSFLFSDGRGNLTESGGVFYDGQGNLCEWGQPFYDSKGNYCDSNSPFYDSKGNYCTPGSPFYDSNGNLINPR